MTTAVRPTGEAASGQGIEALLRRPPLLVGLVTVLIVLPVIVLGELSAAQSRDLLRAQELDAARSTAVTAAQSARSWVAAIREDIAAVAEDAGLQAAAVSKDPERTDALLNRFASTLGLRIGPGAVGPARFVLLTDGQGLVISELANERRTVGRDLSQTQPFPRIRAGARAASVGPEDVVVGDAVLVPFGKPTGLTPTSGDCAAGRARCEGSSAVWLDQPPEPGILMGARIRHAADPMVGALLIQVRPEQLAVTLGAHLGQMTDLYVVDREGVLVAHVTKDSARVLFANDVRGRTSVALALADRSTVRSESVGPLVTANSPIAGTDWSVVVEAPAGSRAAVIEPDLQQQRAVRIVLGLLLLLSAAALARTASRSVWRRDELARLVDEVEDKSRQLEAASKHKSEFLANMSHELRTPLNAIIGFNDVVRQGMAGEVNEKQGEYLTDVRTSAQHLLSLINEILDLSKVEAGRMDLDAEEFSLADVVGASVANVKERAAAHGITVESSIQPGVEAVKADQRKVMQILLNLLSNAVKFTPDGGRIGVRVERVKDEIVVSVRDTGVGMATQDRERLFEEFRQVRGTGREHEGTGLGLALSRKLVQLHGGRMWVDSEVGAGSTFSFTLPTTSVTPILQT